MGNVGNFTFSLGVESPMLMLDRPLPSDRTTLAVNAEDLTLKNVREMLGEWVGAGAVAEEGELTSASPTRRRSFWQSVVHQRDGLPDWLVSGLRAAVGDDDLCARVPIQKIRIEFVLKLHGGAGRVQEESKATLDVVVRLKLPFSEAWPVEFNLSDASSLAGYTFLAPEEKNPPLWAKWIAFLYQKWGSFDPEDGIFKKIPFAVGEDELSPALDKIIREDWFAEFKNRIGSSNVDLIGELMTPKTKGAQDGLDYQSLEPEERLKKVWLLPKKKTQAMALGAGGARTGGNALRFLAASAESSVKYSLSLEFSEKCRANSPETIFPAPPRLGEVHREIEKLGRDFSHGCFY